MSKKDVDYSLKDADGSISLDYDVIDFCDD